MYKLVQLISRSPLCEAWSAINTGTGLTCFVRRSIDSEELSQEVIHETLNESFQNQRKLSGLIVNKARRLTVEGVRIVVEYPYLDPHEWRPLNQSDILNSSSVCLQKVCAAIDYLHLMGMVHLDITPQNILVSHGDTGYRVRLVDLEFLKPAGSTCEGKIFGTGNHIAPEILTNESVSPETDNYSFGKVLKNILDSYEQHNSSTVDKELRDALASFADLLTSRDRLSRTRWLLDSLLSLEIISREEYISELRKLMVLFTVSRCRQTTPALRSNPASLQKFLREDCRILGIHDDLITLLAENYVNRKSLVGASVHRLFTESDVTKLGEHWILKPSDTLLGTLYDILGSETYPIPTPDSVSHGVGVDAVIHRTAEFNRLVGIGRLEQAFITGQRKIRPLLHENKCAVSVDVYQHVTELARVAHKLNRLAQADEFYRWATVATLDHTIGRAKLYCDWATVNIRMANEKSASEIINRGLDSAESEGNVRVQLLLLRLKAWQLISINEFEAAYDLFSDILERASMHNFADVLVLAQYSKATAEWRRGNYSTARNILEKAEAKSIENDLREQLLPIHCTLALVCAEFGDYRDSAEYCDLASESCETLHSSSQLASICLAGVLAHTRMAQFDRAEYWLNRYLECADSNASTHFLLGYNQAQAFLLANSGHIETSVEFCHRALNLPVGPKTHKMLGKTHQILALDYLYMGEKAKCETSCVDAINIFEKLGDRTSISEVSLIAELAKACYDDQKGLKQVYSLVDELITDNCLFAAAHGFLIAMLLGDNPDPAVSTRLAETIRQRTNYSHVPLFTSLSSLVAPKGAKQQSNSVILDVLKQEFPKLVRQEHRFIAMLASMRIANLYGEFGRRRHQRKYLEQALQIAENLGNRAMIDRINSIMNSLADTQQTHVGGEATLLAISQILQEERDFNRSAAQLLEFAVMQTGAERGVLLLKQGGSSRLLPVASLNCDDASVVDVTDFSTSIPLSTLAQKSPTFVDDALIDQRTRGLKSIMLHNVRSIVASPLIFNGETLGVLYLDHHTIPALFSKADINYVSAIANFIAVSLVNARNYQDLVRASKEMNEDMLRSGLAATFLTRDPVVRQMLDMIPNIALSDSPVLLLGESGTGKEILCKMIHDLSKRAKRPFVKLNCAAIASSMMESELFGVAKGVATGVSEREGKFEAADGGTLYMDEIGDMPLEMQAKVLRVIEYQQFERVGSNKSLSVDVRLVYATNRNLESAVREGKFKGDLYYRINAIAINIPPLRERISDITLLIEHFALLYAKGHGAVQFTPEAVAALTSYSWPGNVRELKNLVERYSVLYPGKSIGSKMLPPDVLSSLSKSGSDDALLRGREAESIRSALVRNNWNRSKAARFLGIPLSTLRRKIESFGIRPPL